MELVIVRTYYSKGVNGILLLDGAELCKTIELPWNDNRIRSSCIPEGKYALRKRYSSQFRWHFELRNVAGRSLILFHCANDAMKELKGCIAPVLRHTGEGKGSLSRLAFERMKNSLYPLLEKGLSITLTIKKAEV